jgi:hypothetical protein
MCVSDSLLDCICDYNVIDEAINHSDHLPVALKLTLPVHSSVYKFIQCDFINANASNGLNISSQCNEKALRWDKGDTDSYYYMTGELLYPIYNTLLDCTVSKNSAGLTIDLLDQLYMSTVGALLYASDCCIVTIPQNCLKFWWSSDLSNLKKQSIFSHNSWLTAGKPLSGTIAENKNKDKLRYKLAMKKAKDEASSAVSDKLHETLVEKKFNLFLESMEK